MMSTVQLTVNAPNSWTAMNAVAQELRKQGRRYQTLDCEPSPVEIASDKVAIWISNASHWSTYVVYVMQTSADTLPDPCFCLHVMSTHRAGNPGCQFKSDGRTERNPS
jgi:hypothetical protein